MSDALSLSFAWGHETARLSTEDRRLSDALAVVFAPFLHQDDAAGCASSPHQPTLTARVDDRSLCFSSVGDAVLELEDAVAQRLLRGSEHLLLHAGAVTDGERTILLLGASGAGKTTMTLELVRRGWRFLADEYSAIDATGTFLHPFPRCLMIKDTGAELPAGKGFKVDTWRGTLSFHLPENFAPLEPHPLGELLLVFPEFQPGSATSARSVASAEVCARILPNTFNFQDNESTLWPVLSQIATQAAACHVEYGEVASGIDAALDFLAAK